jgi:hypothetical protein
MIKRFHSFQISALAFHNGSIDFRSTHILYVKNVTCLIKLPCTVCNRPYNIVYFRDTFKDTLLADEDMKKNPLYFSNTFHVSLCKYWILFGKRKHFVLLNLISFSPKHSDCSSHFVLLRMTSREPSANISHPTAEMRVNNTSRYG